LSGLFLIPLEAPTHQWHLQEKQSIEEDTVHQATKPMEIDEVVEKKQTQPSSNSPMDIFHYFYPGLCFASLIFTRKFIIIYSTRANIFLRKTVKAWRDLKIPLHIFSF
jgi:hypothetical protein